MIFDLLLLAVTSTNIRCRFKPKVTTSLLPQVCSSALPQILTLLGLPADFDGTVKIAQEWYCGDDLNALVKRDLVITEEMQLQLSEGFYETVAEIQKQLAGYTYEIVSSG